eukprot:CAMPEP_0119306304 /NCGR_PEP_ID=MMETSP1333-20130426/7085_1 /TAXON_ID=418940 /ORGANISM="Scyphosphaera apsteinii, Strain RCC1455" /LENGTH=354 /DNA_ID=CAMNT_0007309567 /DNA_START=91 /DNA_END=1152 /DNA_ORIENTATION=+
MANSNHPPQQQTESFGERQYLADLFFKADRVLSHADEARANKLRLNYRRWRLGDEAAGPHADVLALQHAASANESRSEAKMKRVKTVGEGVCKLDAEIVHTTAAFERSRTATYGQADVEISRAANRSQANFSSNAESRSLDAARADLPASHAVALAPESSSSRPIPTLGTGGCPFRQGESMPKGSGAGLPPLPTCHQGVVELAGSSRKVTTPAPTFHKGQNTQESAVASKPIPTDSLPKDFPPLIIPGASSLSPDQLAAFQSAYIKALAEQKALLQKAMHPPHSNSAPTTPTADNSAAAPLLAAGGVSTTAEAHSAAPAANGKRRMPQDGDKGAPQAKSEPAADPRQASPSNSK